MSAPGTEAKAAEWLIRLEGNASDTTKAEFDTWIAADARNHAAFLRLEKTWRRTDALKRLRPIDGSVDENVLDKFGQVTPIPDVPEEIVETPAPAKRSRLWPTLIAASLVMAVGASAWTAVQRSEWQVYKTDFGGFERIALKDGSTALLNTNSEIRVRLTDERREIVLTQGEALFTVAHDIRRPFDVQAGDTVVRAVGTAFSVRLREQKQVDVIVTEGRVAIDPPDDLLESKLPRQSVTLPTLSTLAAGESVRVAEHRLQHVQTVAAEDMTRKMAWTQGRLWFDRVTLAEAVREFNRYNRRQLVIDDPAIAELHIGGTYDATDLDSFVAALHTFEIRAFPTRSKADDPGSEVIRLVRSESGH
jgi:transmembrane sensor